MNRVDKSQEQTTSKKVPVSVTRMLTSANQSQNQTQATNISVVNQSKTTDTVVTPAKSGIARNTKGGANVKSSYDKY